MPINIFRGDAVAVAQVTHVIPASVEVGDEFVLTINGKDVKYTTVAATVADVVNGLVAAWNTSPIPEFTEVEASAGEVEGNVTHLVLTARTPGIPFTVTQSTQNTAGGALTIVETTRGAAPVNEVQKVQLVGTYSGGTFTLAVDLGAGTETTGAIAYNATAAAVKTALEGLASVDPGDVLVTGGPGPTSPWFVQWQGQYAESEIAELVIDGTNLTGNATVSVQTNQDGQGLSDTVVAVSYNVLGGHWRLAVQGQVTQNIAYNATATQIRDAILDLGVVNDVDVHGGANSIPSVNAVAAFVIRFYTGTNLAVNADFSDLVSGNWVPSLQYLHNGGQTTSFEIQVFYLGEATGGTFSLTADLGTTGPLDFDANASTIQAAVNAVSSDVFIVYPIGPSLFVMNHFINEDVPQVELNSAGLTGEFETPFVVTALGGGGARHEIQQVTVFASGGTFTLTFDGQTTGAIAWNASAGTVATALEALSNIADVTVTGTGSPGDPWVVTFVDPGNQNLLQMTADAGSLTGGGGQTTEVLSHVVGGNEVQTVTIGGAVTGGTFTLAFRGATTAALAYNASAATIDAALEGLVTVGTGNVAVTGSAGGPYTVTFQGTLAEQNLDMLFGDGSGLLGGAGTETLTIAEATRSRGPHHFDDPDNWSQGQVPETGDDLIVERGSTDLLYGLLQLVTVSADAGTDRLTMSNRADFVEGQKVRITNVGGGLPGGLAAGTDYYVRNLDRDAGALQLSTTLGGSAVDITSAGTGTHWLGARINRLRWNSRYTGNVGNRQDHDAGYTEYRPLYLTIGLLSTGAQSILIGHGQGSCSNRMRLDLGPDQFSADILQTGGSAEPSVPALLLKGTHAGSNILVLEGDVGFACLEGESGAFHRLTQRGGSVQLGAVTFTELDKTGGVLLADEATLNGVLNLRG